MNRPPCLHMYRTKSTKNVPYLFFLVGFLNAVAGVYYGMLARNSTIFYINVVCVVVNLLYMGTYLLVCRSKCSRVATSAEPVLFCSLLSVGVFCCCFGCVRGVCDGELSICASRPKFSSDSRRETEEFRFTTPPAACW
ncbi:hypothetical protein ScPMuIL_018081 [Solemya velum]